MLFERYLRFFNGFVTSLKSLLILMLLAPQSAMAANTQPVITSTPETRINEDNPYVYLITADDVDSDVLSVNVPTFPSFLTFNSGTATLSGTPTNDDVGNHNVKIVVSDGIASVEQLYTIAVSNTNDTPVLLANFNNQDLIEDKAFVMEIAPNFTDADVGDVLTFTADNLPSGLTLSLVGQITGSPTNADALASPFTVKITATDRAQAKATTIFQIAITNVNDAPEPIDDSVVLSEDSNTVIDILKNDVDIDNELLPSTAFITTSPLHGESTIDTSTGLVTYTPIANYEGADSLQYRITDPDGLAGTATVTITVLAVNDAPVAQNDVVITSEDTLIEIDVLANDADIDEGDAPQGSQIIIDTVPSNGAVEIVSGIIRYTPSLNFTGTDSFKYKAADLNGAFTNVATVSITVGAINDIPIAGDDVASTLEDTTVVFAVINNDSDTEDGSVDLGSITVVNAPSHGSVTVNSDGTMTYVPIADYNGVDSLQYTITDSKGLTSLAATVSLTINPVNDSPIANSDLVTSDEDTIIDINILGNDQDVDGNSTINVSSVNITISPINGSLFINTTSGIAQYTPNTDYFGSDSFSYTVIDDGGLVSNVAQVLLTVVPVNDLPRLGDDSATTDEDISITISILPNDSDIDGTLDVSTLSFTQPPASGTATFNSSGEVIYVPNLNFHGNDQFSYNIKDDVGVESAKSATVLLTINSINDAPIAIAGDGSTHEDKSITIVMTGTDVDEDVLDYIVVQSPSNGTLSGTGASRLYAPTLNYNGPDSFTFKANDGKLDSTTATINITVISVNDRPVATAQQTSVNEDSSVVIVMSGTDIDGDTLTYRLAGGDLSGNITGSPPTVTYSPGKNFNGQESLLFIANDGDLDSASESISIQVLAVNDIPTVEGQDLFLDEDTTESFILEAEDIDGDSLTFIIDTPPAHGELSGNAPNLVYQPNENYAGNDSFVFKVNDGNADSEQATVTFSISPNADAPVSVAQSIVGDEDSDIAITLLGTDPDDNVLSYQVINLPTNGTLSGTPPNLIYRGNSNYNGPDSFKFKVSDGNFESDPATVSLTVSPTNDAPVAKNDTFSLSMAGLNWLTLDVLDNDTDLDGDALILKSASVNFGSVAVNDNELRYVPEEGFAGDVTLTYLMEDPSGDGDTALVQLNVQDNASADSPQIDTPGDINIVATGRFTKVELEAATAMDSEGNILGVELVNARSSYPPGAHRIFWKTTDADGKSAIVSQKVNIYPLVSLTKGQTVEEGGEVVVHARLNGPSPIYPLIVPFTVEGTATSGIDYEISTDQIRIEEGTQGELRFETFTDDETELLEEIDIVLGDTPYKSRESTHKVTIIEDNVAPRVSLFAAQDGENRLLVEQIGGFVTVTATIHDPNTADTHTIEWMPSDGLTRTNPSSDDFYVFSTLNLQAGIYQMAAKVTDGGSPGLTAQTEIFIEVVNALPALGSGDTDGDLISDATEGHNDDDKDHIPDYRDPIGDCNLIPEQAGTSQSFLIEGENGGCLRRGQYTTRGNTGGVMLDEAAIEDQIPNDIDAINVGGLFDFVVHDINTNAASYSLVIPQRKPMPADAVYRKYSTAKGWYTFVSDEKNIIWSTQGSSGVCPPPNDSAWEQGLAVGDWCLQLTIEDGGPNDDDGTVNSVITDPGGIAVYNSSNSFPVAMEDVGQLLWNTTATFNVLVNDSDDDNDSIEIINAQAQLGSVEIIDGLTLSYTALENYVGEDVVDYNISDGHGGIASSTLTVTVQGNSAPIAANDSAATTNDKAITIDVLLNDDDFDDDMLIISAASVDVGTVSITSTNKLLYTPLLDFEGTATITYTVKDTAGAKDEGNAYIVVTEPVIVIPPTPPPTDNGGSDSGGGSMGYGLLLMLMVVVRRRVERLR